MLPLLASARGLEMHFDAIRCFETSQDDKAVQARKMFGRLDAKICQGEIQTGDPCKSYVGIHVPVLNSEQWWLVAPKLLASGMPKTHQLSISMLNMIISRCFNMLHAFGHVFIRISSEFHQNFIRISSEFHQNFIRISSDSMQKTWIFHDFSRKSSRHPWEIRHVL